MTLYYYLLSKLIKRDARFPRIIVGTIRPRKLFRLIQEFSFFYLTYRLALIFWEEEKAFRKCYKNSVFIVKSLIFYYTVCRRNTISERFIHMFWGVHTTCFEVYERKLVIWKMYQKIFEIKICRTMILLDCQKIL